MSQNVLVIVMVIITTLEKQLLLTVIFGKCLVTFIYCAKPKHKNWRCFNSSHQLMMQSNLLLNPVRADETLISSPLLNLLI